MQKFITGRRAAALATTALIAGGLSLAAAMPAQATDDSLTVDRVSASEISPVEAGHYNQWHQGYDGGLFADSEDGLLLTAPSQVLKGFDDAPISVEDFRGIVPSIWWGGNDQTVFQVAFATDAWGAYTTLRVTHSDFLATSDDGLTDQWTTSRAIGGIVAGATDDLGTLLDALEDGEYGVVGYGVLTSEGTDTVSGLGFGSANYVFGAPAVAPVNPEGPSSEDLALYLGDEKPAASSTLGLPATLDPKKSYSFTVQTDPFNAETYLNAFIYSTPTFAGSALVAADGTATFTLTPAVLASLPAGVHTLVIPAGAGGMYVVSITIAATGLASTGFDGTLPLVAGSLLLALGAGALVMRRKLAA